MGCNQTRPAGHNANEYKLVSTNSRSVRSVGSNQSNDMPFVSPRKVSMKQTRGIPVNPRRGSRIHMDVPIPAHIRKDIMKDDEDSSKVVPMLNRTPSQPMLKRLASMKSIHNLNDKLALMMPTVVPPGGGYSPQSGEGINASPKSIRKSLTRCDSSLEYDDFHHQTLPAMEMKDDYTSPNLRSSTDSNMSSTGVAIKPMSVAARLGQINTGGGGGSNVIVRTCHICHKHFYSVKDYRHHKQFSKLHFLAVEEYKKHQIEEHAKWLMTQLADDQSSPDAPESQMYQ